MKWEVFKVLHIRYIHIISGANIRIKIGLVLKHKLHAGIKVCFNKLGFGFKQHREFFLYNVILYYISVKLSKQKPWE